MHQLTQRGGIAGNCDIRFHLRLKRHLLFIGDRLKRQQHAGRQIAQIHRLPRRWTLPGVGFGEEQQVVHQPAHVLRLFTGALQPLLLTAHPFLRMAEQNIVVGQDDRQRRLQLV